MNNYILELLNIIYICCFRSICLYYCRLFYFKFWTYEICNLSERRNNCSFVL